MSRSRKAESVRPFDAALRRIAEADRRLRQAAAERLGVGASDLDTLLLLAESGPQASGRIAEALAITTGAVTGLVDRLERQGWVERTRHDTDRRQVRVELAAAKRSAIEALRAGREQALLAATHGDDDVVLATATRVVDAAAERLLVAASELSTSGAEPAADDAGDRAPIGDVEDAILGSPASRDSCCVAHGSAIFIGRHFTAGGRWSASKPVCSRSSTRERGGPHALSPPS